MRTPLSTERVLEAAVALADAGGLESVSMRRLGEALGVESMSLYRYVAGKDDLVNAMVERVVDAFPLPDGTGEWTTALRQNALQIQAILRRHPWASPPLASRAHVGPARLRHIEAVLERMRGGGLSVRTAHVALHAFDAHVMGFLSVRTDEGDDSDAGPEVAALRAGRLAEQYPRIAESMAESVHDEEREFELILDVLLSGFARLAESA